ncbi:MAG: hypothetical protein AAGD14_17615, partial [Planctomycetota bacterium]
MRSGEKEDAEGEQTAEPVALGVEDLMRLPGLLVALFAVIPSGCATPEKDDRDPSYVWPDLDKPVALSSVVPGWQLCEGMGAEVGLPDTLFALLVAVHPTHGIRIVRGPRDFAGVVRITSGAQALEYARLATADRSFHFFVEKDFLEPSRRVAHDFPVSAVEVSPSDAEDRGPGELPSREFTRLGLHGPTWTATPNGFRISRCLGWWEPSAE